MQTRTRIEQGKKIVSVLVLAGTTLGTTEAHVPAPAIRKQGIEQVYIQNGKYSVEKSEARKRELLNKINAIRKEMANVAMSTKRIDEDTICRPHPQKVKEALKSLEAIDRFTERVFTEKA